MKLFQSCQAAVRIVVQMSTHDHHPRIGEFRDLQKFFGTCGGPGDAQSRITLQRFPPTVGCECNRWSQPNHGSGRKTPDRTIAYSFFSTQGPESRASLPCDRYQFMGEVSLTAKRSTRIETLHRTNETVRARSKTLQSTFSR